MIERNFVVIMNDVGRNVGFLSYPVTFDPLSRSDMRMVRSMRRHTINASTRIKPSASIRLGDLRNRAFTMRGSF